MTPKVARAEAAMKLSRTFLVGAAVWACSGPPAAASDVIEREHASMNELPRLVRETLENEAQDGSIEELQKEYGADHSMTYDAEIVREGKITFVRVSSDGTVIARSTHRPPRPREKD
jgi:hypothetical protein